MGCGSSTAKGTTTQPIAAKDANPTKIGMSQADAAVQIQSIQRAKSADKEVQKLKEEGKLPGQIRAKTIDEWGKSVSKQFDADQDGKLTTKELTRALKSLPKTKPSKVPPGTKFQSVEAMISSMDSDKDGSVDETEWLANLSSCAGLYAALEENVNAAGEIATFDAKAEDAAILIQSMQRVKSTDKEVQKLKEEGKLPGQIRAKTIDDWGKSVFRQFDTDQDGKLSTTELTRALKSLPKTKPSKVPPDTKFQSVEAMISSMDSDKDGSVDESEWLANLSSCAGLYAALQENVNEAGEIATFDAKAEA